MQRILLGVIVFIAEAFCLIYLVAEVHERLHVYFAKGYLRRTSFTHCDFLPGFLTKLPWKSRIASALVSNVWDLLLGLGVVGLGNIMINHYLSGSLAFADWILLLIGFSFFAATGVTGLLPIDQDGVVLWNLLISRFKEIPMPDLFTNQLHPSRRTRKVSMIIRTLWAVTFIAFRISIKGWWLLAVIAVAASFIAAKGVWRNYSVLATA